MKIKESPGRIVFRIINVILLLLLAFACLAPLLHVFFASISDPTLLTQYRGGIVLWPLYDKTHPATLYGYSFVNLMLLFTANSLSRKYSETSLF